MYKFHFSFITILCIVFYANSQSSFEKNIHKQSKKIDSLFQKWDTQKTPGLSIAIVENNDILYSKNVGIADLKKRNKITSATTFNLASLTKQFVAYSVLLLEEERKISLDADIQEYLPEIKFKGVTVRHLLNHSSGIPEYWGIWSLSSFKGDDLEDIYNILNKQTKTKFKTGNKYEYSNSNYILLSLIIKKVSHKSLSDFTKERIFKKLGMNHTYFLMNTLKEDTNQAQNYQFNGQNYIASPQKKSDIIGDGGLFSNVEDLLIWNQFFYNNSTINKKRREVGVLNSGETSMYATGLQKFDNNGILSFEHGGGAQGASCYFSQFPEHNIAIIVLSNTDEVNAMLINQSIKSIIFTLVKNNENKTKLTKDNDWLKLQTFKLKSLEGKYYGFGNSATIFDISIGINDTLIGNSLGNPSRKYIQTNTEEFSAVDIPALKLKIQSGKLNIQYQQFNIGSYKKINKNSTIEIVGNFTSQSINNGIWKISKNGKNINVVTPREKLFTLIKLENNIFLLKEMNILLLFEERNNSISLKLAHQGAGEIILHKT
jgi:CubicO group peptidase (beta-lactamase class C family)